MSLRDEDAKNKLIEAGELQLTHHFEHIAEWYWHIGTKYLRLCDEPMLGGQYGGPSHRDPQSVH